jgi:transcriptional regulator with XRE-family HTH domain
VTLFSHGNTRAAKLSNEQVLEMRQHYHDDGWTQAQCARHYGVNVNTVGRIVRGESRQRVPMPSESPDIIAARLMALQEEANRATHDRLTKEAQKEYDKTIKPSKGLEAFKDPNALSKYGVEE